MPSNIKRYNYISENSGYLFNSFFPLGPESRPPGLLPPEEDSVPPEFPPLEEVPPRPPPGGASPPLRTHPDREDRHVLLQDLPEGEVRAGDVVVGGDEDQRGVFPLAHRGFRGEGVFERVLGPPLHVDARERPGRKLRSFGHDSRHGNPPSRTEDVQFPRRAAGPGAVSLLDPSLPSRKHEDRVRGAGGGTGMPQREQVGNRRGEEEEDEERKDRPEESPLPPTGTG